MQCVGVVAGSLCALPSDSLPVGRWMVREEEGGVNVLTLKRH